MCVSSMSQTGQWTTTLHDFFSVTACTEIFALVFPYVLHCSFWDVALLTGPRILCLSA